MAVLAAAAGVPFTLVAAAAMPGLWYAGIAWPVAVLALTLVDALAAPRHGDATVAAPTTANVGAEVDATVTVTLKGARPPGEAEVALAANPLIAVGDEGPLPIALEEGRGAALLPLTMARRGAGRL